MNGTRIIGKKFSCLTVVMLTLILVSSMVSAAVSFGIISDKESIGRSDLEVTLLNQDPDPASPGKIVELRFKVENYGAKAIENIVFTIMPEYPFSLDDEERTTRSIGRLSTRQIDEDGVIMKYRLRVDNNALEGDHEIEMKYSFGDGRAEVTLEPFVVTVTETNKVLSISQVKTDHEPIVPGETLKMNVVLDNLASVPLYDVRINLGIEDPLAPVEGSTTEKIVQSIEERSSVDVPFTLFVDAAATSKVYTIPVTVDYEDADQNSYSTQTVAGITVKDPPSYLLNLEESTIYRSDMKGRVIVSVSNTGTSPINFVSVGVLDSSDYVLLSSNTSYLGNLEPDDFETSEFEVYVKNSDLDQIEIPVKVSYRDSYNAQHDDMSMLKMSLFSMNESVQYGLEKKSQLGGGNGSTTVVIVIVVVAVAWFGWKRYKKWKASQK